MNDNDRYPIVDYGIPNLTEAQEHRLGEMFKQLHLHYWMLARHTSPEFMQWAVDYTKAHPLSIRELPPKGGDSL